jgi:hypothetical protein
MGKVIRAETARDYVPNQWEMKRRIVSKMK